MQTRGAVQLGVVYNYLALMIFPLFVALDRLDPAMREASKDLGASRWKTFRQVTLPLAAPGIVAGLLLVFIPLSGDYITALVLGGAKGNMAGAIVASQFSVAQNWALGAAQAVILIVMIMGTVAVFALIALVIRTIARASRKITHPLSGGGRSVNAAAGRGRAAARRASVALRVWAIVVYVFLFLPILVIVVYSFNNGRSMLTWGGLGLDGYRTGTVDPTILDAVKTSIVAATGTAIIATILGSSRVSPWPGARANGRCSSWRSSSWSS